MQSAEKPTDTLFGTESKGETAGVFSIQCVLVSCEHIDMGGGLKGAKCNIRVWVSVWVTLRSRTHLPHHALS